MAELTTALMPRDVSDETFAVLVRERVQSEAAKLFEELLQVDDPTYNTPDGPRATVRQYYNEMIKRIAMIVQTYIDRVVVHGADSRKAHKWRDMLSEAWNNLAVCTTSMMSPELYGVIRAREGDVDKQAPIMPLPDTPERESIDRRVANWRARAAFDAMDMQFELSDVVLSGGNSNIRRVHDNMKRLRGYMTTALPYLEERWMMGGGKTEIARNLFDNLSNGFRRVVDIITAKIGEANSERGVRFAGVLVKQLERELQLQVYLVSLLLVESSIRPLWVY